MIDIDYWDSLEVVTLRRERLTEQSLHEQQTSPPSEELPTLYSSVYERQTRITTQPPKKSGTSQISQRTYRLLEKELDKSMAAAKAASANSIQAAMDRAQLQIRQLGVPVHENIFKRVYKKLTR